MIKVPGRVKYRSPQYEKVSAQWDKQYGGRDSGVLSPAQIANKVRVRSWIDEQNNLKNRPITGIYTKMKNLPNRKGPKK